jgi:hypothetical protein
MKVKGSGLENWHFSGVKGSGLENWHFSGVPIRPDGLLQRKGTVMTYEIHFGVSQKNTLDNILSDTRFPQYLQAFRVIKIMAIMTCERVMKGS